MHWKIKAALQKLLALSKTGDKLNHYATLLKKDYHKNTTIYQALECIRKYRNTNNKIKVHNTALEIGTGYSLISAFVLHVLGFQKVITVDITNDIRFSTLKKQLVYLKQPELIKDIEALSFYSVEEINNQITIGLNATDLDDFCSKFNITYVAPYTFDDLTEASQTYDYICSQVVLEHMNPKNLEDLFNFSKKNLKKDGFSVHTINFIDHFANPGMFEDTSISEFNFLKYSDKTWDFWAGNSIAYTNRLSYIYYINLCEKHHLKVKGFKGENYREKLKLDDNKIHEDILKKYDFEFEISELTKFQRGTLVIKQR